MKGGKHGRNNKLLALPLILLAFSVTAFCQEQPSTGALISAATDKLRRKEFAPAKELLQKALAANPRSAATYNLLGTCQAETGDYERARRSFQKAIELDPKFVAARVNLGKVFLALKQTGAALREFLAALALDPRNFQALENAGLIYGQREEYDLAVTHLHRAHELARTDKTVTLALAGAEISRGNSDEAKALVAQLTQSGQLDQRARETLALLWLEGGDAHAAAELATGNPELGAKLFKLGYQKAEVAFEAGHYSQARETLEAIRPLETPDAAFHDLLGSVYYAVDNPRKASDEFQEAVRLEPADPEHYYKLGMVFLKHRTPEPAVYIFEKAAQNRPDVPKLWLGLGLSYYFASRLQEAETALRKAIALDPQYEVAYVLLGDLLEQSGRVVDALGVFQRAIEIRPGLYLPYYCYGKLLSKQKPTKVEEAVRALRRAVALDPAFPEAHYELGKALAQASQSQEAVVELEKSLKLKPGLAQAYYQLGLIYRNMGDGKRSAEQFRSFEAASKKQQPTDLIQRLVVQIEKP